MSIEGHEIPPELIEEINKRRKDYEDAAKNGSPDTQHFHDLFQDIAIISLLTIHGGVGPPPPPPPPPPEVELKIIQASATDDDGNLAINVFDGKPDTRWSAKGDNQELYLDVCRSQITRVEIDWYRGDPPNNTRRANFDIKANNIVLHSGSAGAQAIIPVNVETTRITIVGHMNNINDWNSIIEVRLFGRKLEDCDEPPPPPPPPGGPVAKAVPSSQTVNIGTSVSIDGSTSTGNGLTFAWTQTSGTTVTLTGANTSKITFTAPGTSGTLGFKLTVTDNTNKTSEANATVTVTSGVIIEDGVKMMYPKKEGSQVGTFKFSSSNSGRAQYVYEQGECILNQEITGYLFIQGTSNMGEEVSIKVRGGRHTDDDNSLGCCYIIGAEYNGNINAQWECPHPSNHSFPMHGDQGKFNPGSLIGKWFGIKACVYQKGNVDKLECYLDMGGLDANDKPVNDWKLFWEHETDQFVGECNGKGANRVYFRLDDIQGDPEENVELKFATAREIVPSGNPPPPPPPPPDCPPGQHKDPVTGECVPDNPPPPPPPGGEGPYQSTGKELQSSQRGPTVRHYASGKPDDWTIEKNVKNIEFENYQFIVDVTMHEVEHDDTVSLKYGGTHMGSGWFDSGVSFQSGECCIGKEEDHPSTDLCVIRGPKIGNILEKPIKIACVFRSQNNHQELWTKFEGEQWIKRVEGDQNSLDFNPNSDEDECQLRIDGFKDKDRNVPTIRSAIVQEIK